MQRERNVEQRSDAADAKANERKGEKREEVLRKRQLTSDLSGALPEGGGGVKEAPLERKEPQYRWLR